MATLLIIILILLLTFTLFFLIKINKVKLLGKCFILIWILALSTLIISNYQIVNLYTTIFSLIIIFFHLLFFTIGYIIFPSNLNIKYPPKINISAKKLYNILLIISVFGIFLLIYTIDLKKYLLANQVAVLRDDIFSENINIDRRYKMLANFIYPFSIVSSIFFIKTQKPKFLFILLILSILF